jgi:hypothetical protein
MKPKIMQRLAILLILEVGLVHYVSAQHEFEETAFLGYLFIANFLGSLVAAYGIYRHKTWGWGLGSCIAICSLIGYVWSRISGLPGLEAEAWLNPWGLVALLVESAFCLLAAQRPWRALPLEAPERRRSERGRALLPAAGLLALLVVNYATYRLEALFPEQGHSAILTLEEAQREPVISLEEFEQTYGVQVSRVAVSALDSLVDVRLKIIDLDKAKPLIDEHSALLVGDTLILSPHQHRQPAKEGKAYIVFYPNQQNMVKSGTSVSLVFENIRLEPVTAQ